MNSNSTDPKEIRKFGLIGCVFFGILIAVALWRERAFAVYFFGAFGLLCLGFVALPTPLKPVYQAWIKIAHFIGSKISVVILTAIFYLVITPAALLKRVFGGRPLPLRFDPKADTYWVTRPEPAQPKERFSKRN